MRTIETEQVLDIIKPIPSDKFIKNRFLGNDGESCVLGHIYRTICDNNISIGIISSIRRLSKDYLEKKCNIFHTDITSINDRSDIKGYTQDDIKTRVVKLLEDMIENGY